MPNPEVNATLRGEDFVRLRRVVQSPGDIYEVDVGIKAAYIGPGSDISEVRIQYADPDAPLGVQTADVSVNGPFVGGINVDLAARIAATSQPARILVSPVDIVNNTYARPVSGGALPARSFNSPASIDLILALQELPSIPAVRADRTFRLSSVPYENANGPNNGSTDLIIPMYGRRMVTVQFTNMVQFTADFFLVALQAGINTNPDFIGSFSKNPASVPQTSAVVIKASDSVSEVDGTNSAAVTNVDLAMPLPSVKDMADLLVINLSTNSVVDGLHYIDVFVKLSDREG